MAVENIRGAIEAILFANGASVEFSRIAQALEISEKKVKEHISALIDDYEASGRGITIILLDNSCQMVSKKEFAPQIRTVMDLRYDQIQNNKSNQNLQLHTDRKHIHLRCHTCHNSKYTVQNHNTGKKRKKNPKPYDE